MATLRKPPYARTAYLEQTLVAYDGPQLVLFKSDRGFRVLGLAVDEPTAETYPLLLAEVKDEDFRRYLDQKVDLHYIFRFAAKRLYYGNWAALNEQGWLPLIRPKDTVPDAYFPDQGFWSRHHTVEYTGTVFASDTLASFAIDGSWDASDFARFYSKFADLYAFLTVGVRQLADQIPADALQSVKRLIQTLAWRGGGSYVGFYDTMFSKIDALSPLRVNRIQYASPGTIELKGSPDALGHVGTVVNFFAADSGEVKEAYDFVHKVLGKENLKGADTDAGFSSQTMEQAVRQKCDILNKGLGIDSPDHVLGLCDGKVVIYAKITLSFYRRAKALHLFHAEGRVAAKDAVETAAH